MGGRQSHVQPHLCVGDAAGATGHRCRLLRFPRRMTQLPGAREGGALQPVTHGKPTTSGLLEKRRRHSGFGSGMRLHWECTERREGRERELSCEKRCSVRPSSASLSRMAPRGIVRPPWISEVISQRLPAGLEESCHIGRDNGATSFRSHRRL